MKTLKNLFLTILFTIGLVSTSFAIKDTIAVSQTNVYHMVAGNMVSVTSLTVNVNDTIVCYNSLGTTADFIMNATTFTNISSGASFQYKIPPTDAPNFLVRVFVPLNSTTYDVITVYVNNITTGISENTNKIEFGAFPNPVTDVLTVTASKELGRVSVTNTVGQVVFSDLISETKININFAELPPGVYIVQVGSTKKKIIK